MGLLLHRYRSLKLDSLKPKRQSAAGDAFHSARAKLAAQLDHGVADTFVSTPVPASTRNDDTDTKVSPTPSSNCFFCLHCGVMAETRWLERKKPMSNENATTVTAAQPTVPNPLDAIPDAIPFDVPYGAPISLDRAQAVIHAAVAEARNRNWKMNVAVSDSGGNLVAFQRMDGAMLAAIQIAEHKARAAATFRRPTKVFEDGIQLMRLNYLLAFDGVIASRGGIPLIDQGAIIGAIGCSGGTDSQDEVVSKAGAAVIAEP
jgi:glc operon protein GlcG